MENWPFGETVVVVSNLQDEWKRHRLVSRYCLGERVLFGVEAEMTSGWEG